MLEVEHCTLGEILVSYVTCMNSVVRYFTPAILRFPAYRLGYPSIFYDPSTNLPLTRCPPSFFFFINEYPHRYHSSKGEGLSLLSISDQRMHNDHSRRPKKRGKKRKRAKTLESVVEPVYFPPDAECPRIT